MEHIAPRRVSRRGLLQATGGVAAAAGLGAATGGPAHAAAGDAGGVPRPGEWAADWRGGGSRAERPNIVFLIADDHRHDVLGAAGHPVVRTPHLDALAKRGTRLTAHHCGGGMTGAICAPSRAMVMTGRELFQATPGEIIYPDLPLLPEQLHEHGYHTFVTGKWHNGTASHHRAFGAGDGARLFFGGMSDQYAAPLRPFDPSGEYPASSIYYEDRHTTDLYADAVVDFIKGYDDDAPFFAYAAFQSPHDPRMAPAPFSGLYSDKDVPLPENFLPVHPFDNGQLSNRDENLTQRPRGKGTIRAHLADYYAMVSHLDHGVGRILDALRKTGRARNTIVVYTSDHGLGLGSHGLLGKQNLYEHALRTPLIISGPGIPAGRTVDALTQHRDLFPTLAGLAGAPVPDTVTGSDLLPVIERRAGRVHEYVHGAYMYWQRSVSDGRHKLIRYRPEKGTGSERTQLFDLAEDPHEMRDLADSAAHRDVAALLSEELVRWQAAVGDPAEPFTAP
ncbi:sulfatase-like hydrolase/transferase [Streptomyces sp. CMB-StM0423]|uniref:sulfatase-like hydrolase/transferase n=1 Tax=Streptomyces sp. CMB-StM0423 TaxID=2059884 RepID=UPI000C7156CF|nr:sulfatase-like hydrolase/transferase [Streptomyces sp. CMB-StM0423]AUH44585.1 sulfatase [Streptomyces sp. CMB-StM0423]